MIVTTKTGTQYRLDQDAKTFQRLPTGIPRSYQYLRLIVGEPMEFLLPANTTLDNLPYIETPDVVSVEEE